MTVKEALQTASQYLKRRNLPFPRQDGELLLISILRQRRSFLFSHPERRLTAKEQQVFRRWLGQRGNHYPLQYLRERQDFYGREFRVRPGVFIPRPETELLVNACLRFLRGLEATPKLVLDLATGSGCIGVTLACEDAALEVTATDVSFLAVKIARLNAATHSVVRRMHFIAGDVFEPVKAHSNRYHLLVCNPPYVSWGDAAKVDPSVLRYEPHRAVFCGPSGLEFYARLLTEAQGVLHPRGALVLELAAGLAPQVQALGKSHGWCLADLKRDLAGIDRCIVFRRNQLSPHELLENNYLARRSIE